MVATVDWMGRYRRLIEALVRHRNAHARVMNTKTEILGELSMSILEWEVLEYIIEHEADDSSMSQLSERLMIPASTFFKLSRLLCEQDLIAKYRMVGNKKNVILKPTERGRQFYARHSADLKDSIFGKFFEELSGFSDEDLEKIIRALEVLTPETEVGAEKDDPEARRLIRME